MKTNSPQTVRTLRATRQRQALATALLLASCSSLSAQTWTPTAGGTHDWDNSGNWSAAFPNAIDAAADLSADLAGNQTLNLNQSVTVGSLVLNDTGASADSNYTLAAGTAGSLTFQVSSGSATVTNTSNGNTISAPITLASNTTFNVAGSANNITVPHTTLTLSGVIGGSGTLGTTSGFGNLVLSGANTYTGATSIDTGAIRISHATALGSSAAGTTVANGAALQIQGGITVVGEALTLNGQGVNTQNGALRSLSGHNTWTGNVVVNNTTVRVHADADSLTLSGGVATASTRTLVLQGDGNITVSGVISGAGNVSRGGAGSGTDTLSGLNTYTGVTTVSGGVLSINSLANGGSASAIGQSTNAASNLILTGGTLRYTGSGHSTNRLFQMGIASTASAFTATIESSGTGAVNFTNTGAITHLSQTANQSRTLTLGGTHTGDNTFAPILGNNGTGAVSLTKSGAGKWILSGAHTYTGATSVTAGTLFVNGSLAAGSAVSVSSGATLGGSGVINGAVTVQNGGFLAPGAGVGNLTVGSLALGGTSTTTFEIGGSHDGIIVSNSGGLGYGGSLVFDFTSTLANGSVLDLFSFGGSTNGSFASVSSTAIYTGSWAQNGNVWSLASGGQLLSFDLGTGDLSVSAIPEPSTVALLAGLAGLGGAALRRRKRA